MSVAFSYMSVRQRSLLPSTLKQNSQQVKRDVLNMAFISPPPPPHHHYLSFSLSLYLYLSLSSLSSLPLSLSLSLLLCFM